jgi:signal transduction histidine kinase
MTMRRFLVPDSLSGRLITALLVVVGITVAILALLIMRERREVAFWGSDSSGVIELMAQTSEDLAGLTASEREARLEELRREPLAAAEEDGRPSRRPPRWDDSAAARAYQKRLQRELGGDYVIDVRPARHGLQNVVRIGAVHYPGPAARFHPPPTDRPALPGPTDVEPVPHGPGLRHELDVSVRLPGGDAVVYRVPAPRSGPPLPPEIFSELAVLTLVLAIALFVMARTITRPLSALAGAAEAMGRGETPPPLPETGARELREATHAFNTMHERLQRYLNSRTRLLAAMSHDLRTPLTRLRLRSERLADPELRERFNADVDEMNGMLKAALDLFRGMNGDEPASPVDIMQYLDALREEFAVLGATVTVEGSAAGPIEVRVNALKRCLTNLISNAVKFGGHADVRVTDGADLTIRVLDEGPGIPEESLERVFEPFFRLESSRNPETGGTGLGLSIARDIAQAHGGSLELHNRQPRGLEAVLTLPRTTRPRAPKAAL